VQYWKDEKLFMGAKERREREREQRKAQILDTARALLLEKGLNATSINQIAKRAELSVGAIYFYYKSKEDLYAALQVEGLELLSQTIRQSVQEKSQPEVNIRKIAMAYLNFSEEHKNYFDIINYFLASPEPIFSPELKSQVDEHGKDSLATLADTISKGIQDGIFKAVDPRRQAIILWSTLHGMIQFKKLENTILSKESHQSLYLEAVERFLDGQRSS
jgi:AcrR family transcriptional regulator